MDYTVVVTGTIMAASLYLPPTAVTVNIFEVNNTLGYLTLQAVISYPQVNGEALAPTLTSNFPRGAVINVPPEFTVIPTI